MYLVIAGAYNNGCVCVCVCMCVSIILILFVWFQGQAQECFVEKSLRGSARVKPVTIAKLAARVSVTCTHRGSLWLIVHACRCTHVCALMLIFVLKKNKNNAELVK